MASVRWTAVGVAGALVLGACSGSGGGGAAARKQCTKAESCSSTTPGGGSAFADLRSSQDAFLRFATQQLDAGSPTNIIAHAERARRDHAFHWDPTKVTVASLAGTFQHIDDYSDTADFTVMYLLNLWYGYRDVLSPAVNTAIVARLKAWKYWYTDPTPKGFIDQRWYWSENHRLIFHTIEYLAGQAMPNIRFGTNNMLGTEHQARAKRLIDQWLAEKAKYGFDEWHSDVYYQKDVDALLTFIEWADDSLDVRRASGLLDLVMFDLAVHQHKANNGVTHGRSYMKDKSVAADEDVFGIVKLAFATTSEPYVSSDDPGAVLLARARRYQLPAVIQRAARSDRAFVDRERMNLPLDPAGSPTDPPPDGVSFSDPANLAFWWDRGALTAAPIVPLTLATANRYDLWKTDAFAPFTALRDITGGEPVASAKLAASLAPMLALGLLSEVHTYTYRSANAMLSSAIDYRPGDYGDQYHAWQATLDENAIVFTTLPHDQPQQHTEWPDDDGYWTGTAAMPRSAQQATAAIHIYAPAYASQPSGPLHFFRYLPETHAYFPQDHFDTVVRAGNWTFGQRGQGYVALYSWRTPTWRAAQPGEFTHGMTKPFDLVAGGGADNVWITEVGDTTKYPTLDAFRAAVESASLHVTRRPKTATGLPGGFDVVYTSPQQGRMQFGTTGPFEVRGAPVALHPDMRFDNPWSHTAWGASSVRIADAQGAVVLDVGAGTRSVS